MSLSGKFCFFSLESLACQISWLQVFGDVYAAPLTVVDTDDIRGHVEKELAEKELALKKLKPKPKGKAKASASTPAIQDATHHNSAIPIDDEAWSIPSEDEVQIVSNKAQKTGDKTSASAAAKEARAAEKQKQDRARSRKLEGAKASKLLGQLTSMCTSLDGLVKKQTKLTNDEIEDEVRAGLIEARDNIQKWKKCSLSKFQLYSWPYLMGKSTPLFLMGQILVFFPHHQGATDIVASTDDQQTNQEPPKFSKEMETITDQIKAAKSIADDVRQIFKAKAEAARKEAAAKAAEAGMTAKAKASPKRRLKGKKG